MPRNLRLAVQIDAPGGGRQVQRAARAGRPLALPG